MKKHTIAKQLNQFETAIDNALKNAAIKAALLPYGYTVARLNEGKLLFDAADAAVKNATALKGAKQLATADVKKTYQAAKAAYQDLAKVARAIFQGAPAHLTALTLDKAMPRNMDDFAVSAKTLFDAGKHPLAVRVALEANGYGSDRLSPEGAKIAEFTNARKVQSDLTGTAQDAKDDQRQALKALRDWSMAYRKIARVALKDKPELLESLGILHRSSKTKAQRGAPAKAAATRAKKKALKQAA